MANQYIYTLEPGAEIYIEVSGDLVIEGRDGLELKAVGDELDIRVTEDHRRADIHVDGDCHLDVPGSANFHINDIGGDAKITNIAGVVDLSDIGGDLIVRDCGTLKVNSIGGDAAIKRIMGGLNIDSIGGDGEFREIRAALKVDSVGGDALVREVSGSILIDSVGGDLVFDVEVAAAAQYNFDTVGGDVVCKIPGDAGVSLSVPHETERSVEIPNVKVVSEHDEDTIILGDGKIPIRFGSIGGDFRLVGQGRSSHAEADVDIDFDSNFAEEIEDEISAHMEDLDEHLSTLQEELDRATERIQQQAEQAARRAAEKARREADKARQQAERARQEGRRAAEKARRGARGFQIEFNWPGGKGKRGINIGVPPIPPIPPVPPVPPMPPTPPMAGSWGAPPPTPARPVEPVSDQERMMILKMVESKQISVEEAEQLLAALEARE